MDMLSGWIAFMHFLDTVYVKVVTWINELAWMPVGYPKAIDALGFEMPHLDWMSYGGQQSASCEKHFAFHARGHIVVWFS